MSEETSGNGKQETGNKGEGSDRIPYPVSRFPTYQSLWQMMAYRPWLYLIDLILWSAITLSNVASGQSSPLSVPSRRSISVSGSNRRRRS